MLGQTEAASWKLNSGLSQWVVGTQLLEHHCCLPGSYYQDAGVRSQSMGVELRYFKMGGRCA